MILSASTALNKYKNACQCWQLPSVGLSVRSLRGCLLQKKSLFFSVMSVSDHQRMFNHRHKFTLFFFLFRPTHLSVERALWQNKTSELSDQDLCAGIRGQRHNRNFGICVLGGLWMVAVAEVPLQTKIVPLFRNTLERRDLCDRCSKQAVGQKSAQTDCTHTHTHTVTHTHV